MSNDPKSPFTGGGFAPKAVPNPSPAAGGPAGGQQQMPNMAILVLLKSLATPIVLYADVPTQLYEELKGIISSAKPGAPRLIEKPGVGPLKKVAFLDTDILGVAMQAEQPLR